MVNILTMKYADTLALIQGEPEFNRVRAMKRFLLLKDFEDSFLPKYKIESLRKVSHTKALKAYCELRNLAYRTLLRWSVAYRKHGIKGLLPKYGTKRNPSKRPIRYYENKLMATIAIDTRNPLKCLKTLQQIIQWCRKIQPEVKNRALTQINRYFNAAFYEHPLSLHTPLSDLEIKILNHYKAGIHKKYSRKAIAILLANERRTLLEVLETTHVAIRTIYRWLREFNKDRIDSIKVRINAPERERKKAERQTRVIDIIHKLPSLYGINRTTWTYGAIAEAYEKEYGTAISKDKVQWVIHNTNYSWRHARKVLTSPDPEYKAKVERLLDTLQGLKEGERFFFVDEVGPYQVKKYGGRLLMPKDQIETLPEYQKSRGKIQFVAALEAVTNQMIWKFTTDKSAHSVIGLIEKLTLDYADAPAIFMTWDAISVHGSKAVMEWIETHNKRVEVPRIEVVPLPSKAQFLNVIESVFGGMKKAVICNSDYATPHEMQEAIARHFEDRNQFYRDNPKRAGNKIWDKQAFDFDKLIGGLFKKM